MGKARKEETPPRARSALSLHYHSPGEAQSVSALAQGIGSRICLEAGRRVGLPEVCSKTGSLVRRTGGQCHVRSLWGPAGSQSSLRQPEKAHARTEVPSGPFPGQQAPTLFLLIPQTPSPCLTPDPTDEGLRRRPTYCVPGTLSQQKWVLPRFWARSLKSRSRGQCCPCLCPWGWRLLAISGIP